MLDALIQTLNRIEVHGKDNLDMLLGCIQALETINNNLKGEDDGRQINRTADRSESD